MHLPFHLYFFPTNIFSTFQSRTTSTERRHRGGRGGLLMSQAALLRASSGHQVWHIGGLPPEGRWRGAESAAFKMAATESSKVGHGGSNSWLSGGMLLEDQLRPTLQPASMPPQNMSGSQACLWRPSGGLLVLSS